MSRDAMRDVYFILALACDSVDLRRHSIALSVLSSHLICHPMITYEQGRQSIIIQANEGDLFQRGRERIDERSIVRLFRSACFHFTTFAPSSLCRECYVLRSTSNAPKCAVSFRPLSFYGNPSTVFECLSLSLSL